MTPGKSISGMGVFHLCVIVNLLPENTVNAEYAQLPDRVKR